MASFSMRGISQATPIWTNTEGCSSYQGRFNIKAASKIISFMEQEYSRISKEVLYLRENGKKGFLKSWLFRTIAINIGYN